MRIVAIETSGRRGSIATLLGETDFLNTVGQSILPADERTTQSLAPALRDLLSATDWSPGQIELVAVAVGPGSFTGLRIGVTTAKTLAYATKAEVVGVNTLEVVAAQAPPTAAPLWAIMDAQRGELFVAKFEPNTDGRCVMIGETRIASQAAWLAELADGDRITGPAVARVCPQLPTNVTTIPEEFWQPTAEAVGAMAWRAYRAGQRDDLWKLVPHYYRASAAEENAAATQTPSLDI